MKILLVSSYLPFPLLNGGNIRLYNLIKELHKRHQVTLICEIRPNQSQEDVGEVEKICFKVVTVPRKKQWSLKNIVTSALSTQPFLITGHTLPEMTRAIEKELASAHYDLIHVETFYVMQNLPKTHLPVVLVEHNIEYLVYKRYTQKASFIFKPFLSIDVKKIRRAEEASWRHATAVVTVSEDERKIINQKNTFVVANGVDTKQFKQKTITKDFVHKDKTILYIGDYKWLQNRDAVGYIIKEIWPVIKENWKEEYGKVKLWIVGRHMPDGMKKLGEGDSAIAFDDNNPKSTPEIFTEADVLLAPKRVGGGTSYKTLEAMAVGTPVVTNNLGLEGLKIEKVRDILVAQSPKELAENTISLLTDKKKYQQLSQQSRQAIEKTYDWLAIVKDLEAVYSVAVQ